jgi:hypothetical protein
MPRPEACGVAADRVDGAADDLAIEPPEGVRDPAADDHEEQVG